MSQRENEMSSIDKFSDLDLILSIKGIRDFYDDENIHSEQFEQLYHKITMNLEFTENFNKVIPYLKETLTEQQFGIMQVLMDNESRKILAYLAEKGGSK